MNPNCEKTPGSLIGAISQMGLTKRRLSVLLSLSFLTALFEIFGVSIFLPIFQYVRLDGNPDALVSEMAIWQHAIDFFRSVNINISLPLLLLLAFSLFLLRQLFFFLRLIITAGIQTRLVKNWRDKLLALYLQTTVEFQDEMPIGKLAGSLSTEVPKAAVAVFAPVELAVHFILVIVYVIFLSLLSWEMTVLGVGLLVLVGWLPKKWSRFGRSAGEALTAANLKMADFLLSRLRSTRLLRLSQTADRELDSFKLISSEQRHFFFRAAILRSRIEVVIEPVVIALSLGFIFFAYSVLDFSIELIGIYLVVIIRLVPVLKNGFAAWFQLQNALGPVNEVLSRSFDLAQNKETWTGSEIFPSDLPLFTLKNVSYRYPSREVEYALRDVNVKITPQTVTGIVGPSGSGKSTLIDLLPGLRTPTSGTILLNGKDLQSYDLVSIRESIAFAPQDPQLFPGTIIDHIRYGIPHATMEDVVHASKLSEAHQFVSGLPLGYETPTGMDGVLLSGGQRQRIDLARVFLKKAPLIVLDEPTSNLDGETESRFFETLLSYQRATRATMIIISHRTSIIEQCDQVISIKEGRINYALTPEMGTS